MDYSASHSKDENPVVPRKTMGERLFDFGNWYVIGWLLNAAISVAVTEFAVNRPGNPIFALRGGAVDAATKFAQGGIHNLPTDQEKMMRDDFFQHLGGGLTNQSDTINHFAPRNGAEAYNRGGEYNWGFHQLVREYGGEDTGYDAIANKLNGLTGASYTGKDVSGLRGQLLTEEMSRDSVATLANIVTLCFGGFALMAPIKLLEDRKGPIVRWTDKNVVDPIAKLFGQEPATQREREELASLREDRYAYIESEPKQTWGSVLKGRIVALLPLYAFHLAFWKPNNAAKLGTRAIDQAINGHEQFADPDPSVGFGGTQHYVHKVSNPVGQFVYEQSPTWFQEGVNNHAVTDYFKENVPQGTNPGMAWVQDKAEMVGVDLVYSLGAAAGTYAMSKIFAGADDKKRKQEAATSETPSPSGVAQAEYRGAVEEGKHRTRELAAV